MVARLKRPYLSKPFPQSSSLHHLAKTTRNYREIVSQGPLADTDMRDDATGRLGG